ncbi:MAG: hypothetical protein J6T06_06460, partial [Victivallales bacterium]|nr:hypothetical protein [Victivallales bacterium]
MNKKLWILAVTGAMALPQIGTAQFGPKPTQPQQPGKPPVVVVKPGQPQPAPAVKPAPKPQPAPVVKPAPQPPPKPQPHVVVKPAPQPPPKPQPAVVVKPAAPQPAPPKPAPAPDVVYRPGHKNHPLQPPKERDHYKDWAPLHHKK